MKPVTTLRLAILVALSLPAFILHAGDWTQFRGPHASGISGEDGLPVQLDAQRHLAWQIELPGRGLSSPIIVGDRLFVTCASGSQQDRLHVIYFDTKDGSKVWERTFWAMGRTMTHPKTCVAASTPVTDGRYLFALFSSNDLLCLDLDGNLIWMRGLTRDYPNVSNSLGMASSLILAADTLVVQVENDSESLALGIEPRTGTNRWKIERPKAANWTSPVVLPGGSEDRAVVALQSTKGIHAVDPATGHELWSFTEGAAPIPSSAATDGVLYVPSNGITALKPTSSAEPEKLWQSRTLRPATASPVVFGGRLYVLNSAGILSCGDTGNGERLWQLRMEGPFSATPVVAGKYLYCVNENGLVQVVDSAAAEGEIVGQLDLGATILGTPSIAHGALYIRGDHHLWKFTKG